MAPAPKAVETFILVSVACMFGVCIDVLIQAYSTGIFRPSWIPNNSIHEIEQFQQVETERDTLDAFEANHWNGEEIPSRQLVPAPPMISHASFGPGGILSSLSHALDPVPPLELSNRVPRQQPPPSYQTNEQSSNMMEPSHSIPAPETNHQSHYAPSTSWSWSNYTFPPHSIWPKCSSVPNCLKFNLQTQGCDKWKHVANYPILVGDMDGSGSRGITWLLRAGGVWMRTTNEWLDWAKDEHPLSNALMQSTHTLDYQVKQLPKDLRTRAENQVKGVLKEFTNVAQTQLSKWQSRNLKPWEHELDAPDCPRRIGWKHGPTLFLQPIYNHVTEQKFTFVHLIRDGRDMAFSRNRNNLAKYPKFGGQVVGLFKLGKSKNYNKCFFKPNEKHSAESDRECIVMQMRLWERMNLGAASYGQREMGNRYVPVRVEDFILPDDATRADTIIHLFGRLGLDTMNEPGKARELSNRIFGSKSLRSHFSIERWGGCDPKIIDEVEAAGLKGLLHFGYLPWKQLQQQQRAKGEGNNNGCSVGASQIQVPGVK